MDVTAAVTEQAMVLAVPRVDPTTLHALADAMAPAPPPALVVLDLRRLADLPAADARSLLAVASVQARRGVRCVVLAERQGAVSRVLATADPDGVLSRFADLEEALLKPVPAEPLGVDDLVPQFEVLTRTLLTATSVAAALEQILRASRHLISAAAVASVTLRTPDGTFTTPVETDSVATALDLVQYRTGRGPCVDVAAADGPGYVISSDLSRDDRWPEFAAAATENGLTGVLATELMSSSNKVVTGALNIFTRHHDRITETDRHTALLLATHASLALAHMQTTELAELHHTQMRRAIDTRDMIGQAKGILMNRQGITAEEAFSLLRRTSQDLNVRLVEVATTLVTRRGELDDRPLHD
ncbi:ANTAR domain-containing protein [Lentzea sp. NPDC059081]|uniref:ANTAR domain-containing protein n=1 Tax=Lentzea sp. NPDC059081 TaxID=3346719 RepID=UPI0036BF167A